MSLASTLGEVNFLGEPSLCVGTRRQLKEFNIKGCREVRFSCGGAVFAAANGTSVHLYATYTCELLGVMRCVCGSDCGSVPSDVSRSNKKMRGPTYCSLRVARSPCPEKDEVEGCGKILTPRQCCTNTALTQLASKHQSTETNKRSKYYSLICQKETSTCEQVNKQTSLC